MSVICSKFLPWGQRSFLNSTMRVLEHNMLIHPTSKIGACVLLCHPTLLSFSFLVIDRNSSISQVDASNVTDSCYRMTRKLNESNVGWQSSTQAPILEVGWINILCSITLSIWTEENTYPSQPEEWTSKQHYTVTLFDCNHLAYVIVLWQMQKFKCYCTVFALFYFEFEGNFWVQGPRGLHLEGNS